MKLPGYRLPCNGHPSRALARIFHENNPVAAALHVEAASSRLCGFSGSQAPAWEPSLGSSSFLLLVVLLLAPMCVPAARGEQGTPPEHNGAAANAGNGNELAGNPSPYLAMHGHDPVDWHDWGPQAIETARKQGRLLFISSGYFACHWCHVMHRESYSDPAVARWLNRYLPIKVDRELNPALDARLIDFVERTRGRAGWPLNVILTPEGYPLYGFTYLPRDQFLNVLKKLQALWERDRKGVEAMARQGAQEMRAEAKVQPLRDPTREFTLELEKRLVKQALARGDQMAGGFGNQTKFPMVPQLATLLDIHNDSRSEALEDFLRLTLDRMATQGMHDAIGGGFFRYTMDPAWQRPHFEKMLYDNAQLAWLYLRAARVYQRPDYRRTGLETLDFMLRELHPRQGPPGARRAFIASLSAVDDQDIEGGYYLWRPEAVRKLLTPEEYALAEPRWGLDGSPLTEDGYLPVEHQTSADLAKRLGLSPEQVQARLESARAKLLQARQSRLVPRDTKVLAGWNGLALVALAEAVASDGGKAYAEAAAGLRDYLTHTLWDGKQLYRAVHDGKGVGTPSLEDYAYVAWGLLAWSKVYTDPEAAGADRALARTLLQTAWQRFFVETGWRLSEQSLLPELPPEPVVADGPLPSASATVIRLSLRIAPGAEDPLRQQSRQALGLGWNVLERSPLWYATQVAAMMELWK